MRDLMGLMQKAQQMQAKMAEMQSELENTIVEGTAGGGMVTVQLTAKGDLREITIDPEVLKPEDREIVQDLVVAAHADARRKAEAIAAEKMQSATAGLPLPPGMKLPF
jgi:nucleoid-associated protein EbfC